MWTRFWSVLSKRGIIFWWKSVIQSPNLTLIQKKKIVWSPKCKKYQNKSCRVVQNISEPIVLLAELERIIQFFLNISYILLLHFRFNFGYTQTRTNMTRIQTMYDYFMGFRLWYKLEQNSMCYIGTQSVLTNLSKWDLGCDIN